MACHAINYVQNQQRKKITQFQWLEWLVRSNFQNLEHKASHGHKASIIIKIDIKH